MSSLPDDPLAPGAPVPLAQLAPGSRAVIASVDLECGIGRRLLDLGFVPATVVSVLRRAPLGDPISYEIRGTRICLRRSEAARILVHPDRNEAGA
ncbi:MAG: ferrous iron transport protein A [Myxococcales bacterium]|nr:ferrous iron transport protein A [Myxococcales bacterium]MDH5306972.1 ferrous iron transport protein A [Myxococcales bacterium]MDH5565690.1 ferrous iron transport protein A [Myxococcales bacterium]